MLRLFNGRLWNARWQQTYKVYFHYVDWAPVFILFHSLITCRGQAPVTFVYLKSKCILVECIQSFVHQKHFHCIKAINVNNVYNYLEDAKGNVEDDIFPTEGAM